MPKLDALENEIFALRTKIGNGIEVIADDAEAPLGIEWIRESDWDTFKRTVDDIYDKYYPIVDEDQGINQWPEFTRAQCEDLITRFANALNTVKAQINFTPETPAVIPEAPAETSNETTSGASAAATVETYATTSSVSGIKSTVDGVYIVNKVNGIAFTTPLTDITTGYGLAAGERAFVKVLDLNPKKCYLAQAVIDNAAAALGAEAGPALYIEIGKMDAAGSYSLLSQDGSEVTVKVGIPANFVQEGKTFTVVCVRSGGAFSFLKDLDADPNTVTFATTGGAGAYAIVKY